MTEKIVTIHISPYHAWQGPAGIAPSVRCTNCGTIWAENDLERRNCGIDTGRCDACPDCGTDHYLMDLPQARKP